MGVRVRAALAAIVAMSLAAAAAAAEFRAGSLTVKDPWSRPTPPGIAVGVVYLSITNRGAAADRLLAVTSPRARAGEIHESRMVQGVMQMRAVAWVDCAPGATVTIGPGGLHLMLLGLDTPLAAGSEFPVALRFRDAGTLTLSVRVEARE